MATSTSLPLPLLNLAEIKRKEREWDIQLDTGCRKFEEFFDILDTKDQEILQHKLLNELEYQAGQRHPDTFWQVLLKLMDYVMVLKDQEKRKAYDRTAINYLEAFESCQNLSLWETAICLTRVPVAITVVADRTKMI